MPNKPLETFDWLTPNCVSLETHIDGLAYENKLDFVCVTAKTIEQKSEMLIEAYEALLRANV